jgi:ribose transport system substrate-binding protein
MNGQRTALWALALVAVIAAIAYRIQVFSEPAPPPPAKILFVTGGTGPYWDLTVAGANAAAKRNKVELDVRMPPAQEGLAGQMEILTRIDDGIDGVALSPIDSAGQTHMINDLSDRMRVVTFDTDAKLSERHSHIGASNFSAGRTCARLVGEAVPRGGKVAVLISNQTQENLIERKSGFNERIVQMSDDKLPDGTVTEYTVVGYFEDDGNRGKCAENIAEVLKQNPELACFVGLNSMHGPVLLEELKKLGKLGQIKLVTFDADEATLDGIEQGYIHATVAQDPYKYGLEAVNTLVTLCQGEGTDLPIVGRGSTYLPVEAIRQDNLEPFRDAMRQREKAAGGKAEAKAEKPAA